MIDDPFDPQPQQPFAYSTTSSSYNWNVVTSSSNSSSNVTWTLELWYNSADDSPINRRYEDPFG